MKNKTIVMTDALYEYVQAVSPREPEILRELREETAAHPRAGMQIAADQGQFMRLLVELLDVRRALEVGVFTGYSSLSVALAMAPEGRLVACDVSEEYTSVARRYWERAGVADKIDLRIAPAVETLDRLIEEGQSESFDFMFVDADKAGYPAYYERGLRLLRRGGLMAIDNVLWSGEVADPEAKGETVVALREFNEAVGRDERVTVSTLPLADGLTLARKR